MKIAMCLCPQWSLVSPPFALGNLTRALRENGFEVKQYDINMMGSLWLRKNGYKQIGEGKWGIIEPWTTKNFFRDEILPKFESYWKELIEELSKFDVVSFTIYESNIMVTDYFARYLREINPDIHIWYGGPHCWYGENGGLVEAVETKDIGVQVGDEMWHREFIDIGCSDNEGENIIVDLAKCLERDGHYENVKGVWRWDKMRPSFPTIMKKGRSGREPVYGGMPVPVNINLLEPPMFDENTINGYEELKEEKLSSFKLPVQGSRGCTFKCTFCAETRLYRYKHPKKIISDMKELSNSYGSNSFFFTDSLINGSMKLFENMIDSINDNVKKGTMKEDIKWGGYFRTHKKMTTELLKKAKQSGVEYLCIGMESGVAKILGLMEKRQTPDLVKSTLKACSDNDLRFDANLIPGFPKENHMDFLCGMYFLYEIRNYFQSKGRIYLMQNIDVIENTPLDVYRDVFDISKTETLLKNWVSNDYKNNIFVRKNRVNLYALFMNMYQMNQNTSLSDVHSPIELIDFDSDGDKEPIEEDMFKNKFLKPLSTFDSTIEDIVFECIVDDIKSYVWLLHNVKKNPKIEFKFEHDLSYLNLDDVVYDTYVKFSSQDDNYKLLIELKIKVGKQSKEFLDIRGLEDLNIEKKFYIIGKFDNNKSTEVEDLYLDAMDIRSNSVNLKRTSLTGQY